MDEDLIRLNSSQFKNVTSGCSNGLLQGGVIFAKKFWAHVMLLYTVLGPQIQNFTLICCFFTWLMASQGLRKPLKSLKRPKTSNFFYLFNILKVSLETKTPRIVRQCGVQLSAVRASAESDSAQCSHYWILKMLIH